MPLPRRLPPSPRPRLPPLDLCPPRRTLSAFLESPPPPFSRTATSPAFRQPKRTERVPLDLDPRRRLLSSHSRRAATPRSVLILPPPPLLLTVQVRHLSVVILRRGREDRSRGAGRAPAERPRRAGRGRRGIHRRSRRGTRDRWATFGRGFRTFRASLSGGCVFVSTFASFFARC